MKIEELLKVYKSLLFSVLCFFSGIITLINQEYKHFSGWFILAISFGFLGNFFEKKIKNPTQRKFFVVLTYTVVAGLFLYALTKLFR
jgi:FtsH-binding integral membrane protein